MFSWPIFEAARASLKKRDSSSSRSEPSRRMTFTATRESSEVCWARYTVPIAPSPILARTTYLPTADPTPITD
jgi:hypothetical protein